MSETEKPQQGPEQQGPRQQSGAGAPAQPEQAQQGGQAPPEQPVATPAAAPAPPPARRPPRTVRAWVAAVAGAVLLVGGGLGGYAIGAANDHDRDRPGFSREHRPDFRDFPWRGDEPPGNR